MKLKIFRIKRFNLIKKITDYGNSFNKYSPYGSKEISEENYTELAYGRHF
jgi:hypothetical protein